MRFLNLRPLFILLISWVWSIKNLIVQFLTFRLDLNFIRILKHIVHVYMLIGWSNLQLSTEKAFRAAKRAIIIGKR